jgi:hypothetical protein
MDRLLLALAIAAAAAAVAVAFRRRRADAPIQPVGRVPAQLDRADFAGPGKPWLVAVFTSPTCDVCADVRAKAEVLAADEVAVAIADFGEHRELHARYRIDAVPLVLIADAKGVVRASFLGPVSATDLWAAVAAARDR